MLEAHDAIGDVDERAELGRIEAGIGGDDDLGGDVAQQTQRAGRHRRPVDDDAADGERR